MRTLIFLLLFSTSSYAQSTGKSTGEKGGSIHMRRPHKQMRHFDEKKKDSNLKSNGTRYRRKRKVNYYNVDGDGFRLGPAMQNGR
jgi:hypothetical protein